MSTDQQDTPGRSPAFQRVRSLDKVCDEFEADWLAGLEPRIEDYVDRVEGSLRRQLVVELVHSELDLKVSHGIEPDRDEYIRRFPDHMRLIERTIDQTDSNDQLKYPTSRLDSATSSTPGGICIRCPHCHSPIELVVDAPLDDIKCDRCDSHFSLVQDETTTRAASTIKTVGQFELIERLGLGGFCATSRFTRVRFRIQIAFGDGVKGIRLWRVLVRC